jgi:hypothetical protein
MLLDAPSAGRNLFMPLRFDAAIDVGPLELAARSRAVPLEVTAQGAATYYGGGLVLSRPDQHAAWRGDGVPANPPALIDRVRGAAIQSSEAASGHGVPMA